MNVAIAQRRTIARPIKMLVPLIKQELERGDSAGHDHYRRAGEMLIEAKSQTAHGSWGPFLKRHFELSPQTANLYMRWAKAHNQAQIAPSGRDLPGSLREFRGATERDREHRQSGQQQAFIRTLREIARDDYVQERQSRDDENELRRELALQLIDLGFRGLATKLHPDRGGSRDAMARLNAVRDALKSIAQSRRYV